MSALTLPSWVGDVYYKKTLDIDPNNAIDLNTNNMHWISYPIYLNIREYLEVSVGLIVEYLLKTIRHANLWIGCLEFGDVNKKNSYLPEKRKPVLMFGCSKLVNGRSKERIFVVIKVNF